MSQAQVMVVVDVSELSTDAEAIEEQVLLRSEYTLEQANLIPSRVPDFMLIRVTIQTGEGGGGYRAELTAEKGGKALETGRSLSCDLCTDSELVISVQRRFADLIHELYPESPLVETEPDAPEQPVQPRPQPPRPQPVPDDGKLLGPMGQAGTALAVFGLAATGVGVGFLVYGQRPHPENPLYLRDLETPGYLVVGVGGAVMLTGVALIIGDRIRAKRRAEQRRVSWLPGVGPRGVSLGVAARF